MGLQRGRTQGSATGYAYDGRCKPDKSLGLAVPTSPGTKHIAWHVGPSNRGRSFFKLRNGLGEGFRVEFIRSTMQPSIHDHVPIEPWDVDVTAGAARLLTSPSSLTPELEDCLTLLAQQIKLNNELMRELIQTQRELAKAINEDGQSGDGDDEPSRYLDGSAIR